MRVNDNILPRRIKELHHLLRLQMQATTERSVGEGDQEPLVGADGGKSQRFFQEAAEQHVQYVNSRQSQAVDMFGDLGVNLKGIFQRWPPPWLARPTSPYPLPAPPRFPHDCSP
jgi:hypothetical protein